MSDNRKSQWLLTTRVLLLAIVCFALLQPTLAQIAVNPGQGVSFQQGGFDYSGLAAQPYSQYGMVFVDYATLNSSLGASSGFVNVVLSNGQWAVQNLPVQSLSGYPGLSMYFDLGSGANNNPVSSLGAYVSFSTTAQMVAPVGTDQTFDSTNGNFTHTVFNNAQGDGAPRPANPGAPNPNGGIFGAGKTTVTFQPGHTNVEQDVNQCGPGAIANSFDYLKNRYKIKIPNANTPGIAGQPPGSLVGQIDSLAGRAQGQTISNMQFLTGKLTYLANNKITGLSIDHQGGDGAIGTGNVTIGGLTSHYDGKVNVDWIIRQVQAGQDVEMNVRWDGGGGHWVDLIGGGYINGNPWVAFVNDANQGFDAKTGTTALNGGVGLFDGGLDFSYLTTDNNGNVRFQNWVDGNKARVNFVVAESLPEPTTILLCLSAGTLAFWRKRRPS
jgi:hypothetical protein